MEKWKSAFTGEKSVGGGSTRYGEMEYRPFSGKKSDSENGDPTCEPKQALAICKKKNTQKILEYWYIGKRQND